MPIPIPLIFGAAALGLFIYEANKKKSGSTYGSGTTPGAGTTPGSGTTSGSGTTPGSGGTTEPYGGGGGGTSSPISTWVKGDTTDLSGTPTSAGIAIPPGPYGFSTTPTAGPRTVSRAEMSNAYQKGFASGAPQGYSAGKNGLGASGPDTSSTFLPDYTKTPYGSDLAGAWVAGAQDGYSQGFAKGQSERPGTTPFGGGGSSGGSGGTVASGAAAFKQGSADGASDGASDKASGKQTYGAASATPYLSGSYEESQYKQGYLAAYIGANPPGGAGVGGPFILVRDRFGRPVRVPRFSMRSGVGASSNEPMVIVRDAAGQPVMMPRRMVRS